MTEIPENTTECSANVPQRMSRNAEIIYTECKRCGWYPEDYDTSTKNGWLICSCRGCGKVLKRKRFKKPDVDSKTVRTAGNWLKQK